MANTIKMAKGDLVADIFNSEKSIKQAERDGYHVVEEKPVKEKKETKK